MRINVYDILPDHVNEKLAKIGMGIYHSGVEIGGIEYAYGGNALMKTTGVYMSRSPKRHELFRFRESIVSNFKVQSFSTVVDVIYNLEKSFKANKYDMLKFNCNHFCETLLR